MRCSGIFFLFQSILSKSSRLGRDVDSSSSPSCLFLVSLLGLEGSSFSDLLVLMSAPTEVSSFLHGEVIAVSCIGVHLPSLLERYLQENC